MIIYKINDKSYIKRNIFTNNQNIFSKIYNSYPGSKSNIVDKSKNVRGAKVKQREKGLAWKK
jgi:hypothetical protein